MDKRRKTRDRPPAPASLPTADTQNPKSLKLQKELQDSYREVVTLMNRLQEIQARLNFVRQNQSPDKMTNENLLKKQAEEVSSLFQKSLEKYSGIFFMVKFEDPNCLNKFLRENPPAPALKLPVTDFHDGPIVTSANQIQWPKEIAGFLNEKMSSGITYQNFLQEYLVFFTPSLKGFEVPGFALSFDSRFMAIDTYDEVNQAKVHDFFSAFNAIIHEARHGYQAKTISRPELFTPVPGEGAARLAGARMNKQFLEYLKKTNQETPEYLTEAAEFYLANTFFFWAALDILGIQEKPLPEETAPNYFENLPQKLLENRAPLMEEPSSSLAAVSYGIAKNFILSSENQNIAVLVNNPKMVIPLARKILEVLSGRKSPDEVGLPEEIKNELKQPLTCH